MTDQRLAEIFKEWNGKCIGVCISFGLCLEDAEDIVQDVFFQIRSCTDDYPGSLTYVTTKNACLNFIKLKKKRGQRELVYSESKDYIEMIEIKSGLLEYIYKEVESLPPQRKKIVQMFIDGFKEPQIAEELKINVNTVRVQIFRFRTHLKPSIDNYF